MRAPVNELVYLLDQEGQRARRLGTKASRRLNAAANGDSRVAVLGRAGTDISGLQPT